MLNCNIKCIKIIKNLCRIGNTQKCTIIKRYKPLNVFTWLFFFFSYALHFTTYPQAVNDWLNGIYKKSPMDLQITPHGFRHPHCSLLFEIGASIKETGDRFAKFMGM